MEKWKPFIICISCFLVIFLGALPVLALSIESGAAVLMDVRQGEILYTRNADQALPPASITKIMTLLIVFEELAGGGIALDDTVYTSRYAASMGGSQVWLEPGEERSLAEMLNAIAVVSANDASVAVAEHVAGSNEAFVALMNRRAEELGLEQTWFQNVHGLPAEGHYMSAYDIAVLARKAIRHPLLLEYTARDDLLFREGEGAELRLFNTNRLLASYEGMDGLKTGHTREAGYCLAATAEQDGRRLIAVVMQAESPAQRREDISRLLDYGFRAYYEKPIYMQGETVGEIEIRGGVSRSVELTSADDLRILLRRGENPEFDHRIELVPEAMVAPVAGGEKLAKLFLTDQNGKRFGKVELLAAEDIPRAGLFLRAFRGLGDFFKRLFGG